MARLGGRLGWVNRDIGIVARMGPALRICILGIGLEPACNGGSSGGNNVQKRLI